MTVGCYNFTGADWTELGFPLDLWLEWNIDTFDQVALAVYGDAEGEGARARIVNLSPKVGLAVADGRLIIKELPYRANTGYSYSNTGMLEAMHLLTTDWKYLLAIDEFVPSKPEGMRPENERYLASEHHLWGSTAYEIKGGKSILMLPPVQVRLHNGDSEVYRDDLKPNEGKTSFRYEFWHTGYCRDPSALFARLKRKIANEIDEGIPDNGAILGEINRNGFDYSRWRELFPGAYLELVNPNRLPKVLRFNRGRFSWWSPDEAPASSGDR